MLSRFYHLRRALTGLRRTGDRFRRGVTAVEFALIAPVFFMIFIGIVEMSLMMLAQHLMENATFNASRIAKTGYIANNKTQLETVMDVIDRELGSLDPLIRVAQLTFTSTVYTGWNAIGQPDQGTEGLGTANQIVVYTVSYPWKVFTPMIGNIIADDNGIINLSSRIVIQNEPYNAGG
jgi:Flp pilus assembly protein TadG